MIGGISIEMITNTLYLISAAVVIGGIAVILRKRFGKNANGSREGASTGKAMKRLKDTASFIPVEWLMDGKIKMEGEQRYVASVNCRGCDFWNASFEEQRMIQNSYCAFLNTVNRPFTMHISSAPADLSAQMARNMAAKKKLTDKCLDMKKKFTSILNEIRNKGLEGEQLEKHVRELRQLDEQIEACERRLEHLNHLMLVEKHMSGRDGVQVREERYVIDWQFDPTRFPRTITQQQIEERADIELGETVRHMRNSLSAAHVLCIRDNDEAIYNNLFRHFRPFTSGFRNGSDMRMYSDNGIVAGNRAARETERKYKAAREDEEIKTILDRYNEITEQIEREGEIGDVQKEEC